MNTLPILPVKDFVMMPDVVYPIFIGRSFSMNAVKIATDEYDLNILVVKQKNDNKDDVDVDDLESVGVVCEIIQTVHLPDGSIKLLISAGKRVKLESVVNCDVFLKANFLDFDYEDRNIILKDELENLKRICESKIKQNEKNKSSTHQLIQNFLHANIGKEILSILENEDDFDYYAKYINTSVFISELKSSVKQKILSISKIKEQFFLFATELERENELNKLENAISKAVKNQLDDSQKEYYLNEKIKAIRKELGSNDSIEDEVSSYKEKLKKLKASKHIHEKISEEIKKLSSHTHNNMETSIIKTYLDTVFSLPWNKLTKYKTNIKEAEAILEESHYGMNKVKERILEDIAKKIYSKDLAKGSILCLHGHPGVGKTTISKAIAESLGLEFIKISLGGIRDEAEIRGHRRTYIGAMPGKIISSLKKAKTNNPVILLDEIDKIDTGAHRGDPASALLEALDPEQNHEFMDNYLDLEYDLSKVFFVATANTLNIPGPLKDRMEIIDIPSYIMQEKFFIAKKYIIQKQIKEHNLEDAVEFEDAAINEIIKHYTHEAGVRNLSRAIAKILRKITIEILEKPEILNKKIKITCQKVYKLLGEKKYEHGVIDDESQVGIVNGLAYTDFGGDSLIIETALLPYGKGEIRNTGKLGEVMRESIQTAFTFVKANAEKYKISKEKLTKYDIHLHVPEGATPKDGPSAGIAIATAIISLLTDKKVKNTVGMTGEITLRGKVLPIGGLREKLTSAIRAGIKTVIVPFENKKDVNEIPDYIKKQLKIVTAKYYDEVEKEVF